MRTRDQAGKGSLARTAETIPLVLRHPCRLDRIQPMRHRDLKAARENPCKALTAPWTSEGKDQRFVASWCSRYSAWFDWRAWAFESVYKDQLKNIFGPGHATGHAAFLGVISLGYRTWRHGLCGRGRVGWEQREQRGPSPKHQRLTCAFSKMCIYCRRQCSSL